MKRFVVCLDGTWNNTSRETERDSGSTVYRPTNVLKLARATKRVAGDGTTQITYYNAGVGAMNRAPDLGARIVKKVDNVIGGGWGSGFEVNIEEAYTFLADNFEPGDEIFVFGFSRGASQARSLCRLIQWAGGFPTKNDVYYVPRIISGYIETKGDFAKATLWEEMNKKRAREGRRPLDAIQDAGVRFLGVWDTVLALGSRFRAGGGTTRKEKQFHTPATPPANVQTVRHAIAIDESRHDFQPEVFDLEHDDLEQRWFAGVHSNVGGGLDWDGLANCALGWIVKEASDAGLDVRGDFLGFYKPVPEAIASGKSTGFKIADTVFRPIRGFHGVRDPGKKPGATLDGSVLTRLNYDPKTPPPPDEKPPIPRIKQEYRPKNLLKFLAANPAFDDQLAPKLLDAVRKHRK